jgi:hypothetical protein
MRMGEHIAQDQCLVAGLVGTAVGKIGSNAVRSLLAHEPPAEVCEYALTRLAEMPDPPVRMGPRVTFESQTWTPWLRAILLDEPHPGISEEVRQEIRKDRKAYFAKIGLGDHAISAEMDLSDTAKMRKEFDPLYDEYKERAEMAAEIMAEPYPKALPTLLEIEKEVATSPNFLIRRMIPSVARLLTHEARAQSNLRATKILAAAALHKAKTGKCPEKLDDLKPYFPKGVPLDPLADKDFSYQLEDGKPCVASAGPPPESGEKPDKNLYVFSLAEILQREKTGQPWNGK